MTGGPGDDTPDSGIQNSMPSTRAAGEGIILPSLPEPQHAKRASPDKSSPAAVTRSDDSQLGQIATNLKYRSAETRERSVYRRANPWWRRVARSLTLVAMISVVGGGLYIGARAVDKVLAPDRLPSIGVRVDRFRTTSFLIRASTSSLGIDGTLTLDVTSGAFEFTGQIAPDPTEIKVVSVDASSVFVMRTDGVWRVAGQNDPTVSQVTDAMRYLVGVITSDDLVPRPWRQKYVVLVDSASEASDETVTRYDMLFNTAAFSRDEATIWTAYRMQVIPDFVIADAVAVSMWIDTNDVLVHLRDDTTGWEWQRLSYDTKPFVPFDPSGEAISP